MIATHFLFENKYAKYGAIGLGAGALGYGLYQASQGDGIGKAFTTVVSSDSIELEKLENSKNSTLVELNKINTKISELQAEREKHTKFLGIGGDQSIIRPIEKQLSDLNETKYKLNLKLNQIESDIKLRKGLVERKPS